MTSKDVARSSETFRRGELKPKLLAVDFDKFPTERISTPHILADRIDRYTGEISQLFPATDESVQFSNVGRFIGDGSSTKHSISINGPTNVSPSSMERVFGHLNLRVLRNKIKGWPAGCHDDDENSFAAMYTRFNDADKTILWVRFHPKSNLATKVSIVSILARHFKLAGLPAQERVGVYFGRRVSVDYLERMLAELGWSKKLIGRTFSHPKVDPVVKITLPWTGQVDHVHLNFEKSASRNDEFQYQKKLIATIEKASRP